MQLFGFGEDPKKVDNIVHANLDRFSTLYSPVIALAQDIVKSVNHDNTAFEVRIARMHHSELIF